MELTPSIIHKRPQSYPGVVHQPTAFCTADSFQPLPLDYQPAFEQNSLVYGQTSGFENSYTPQFEQAPAKRRKLDNFLDAMPPRYSTEYGGSSEKASALNSYDASVDEQQFLLARWAQPVMHSSQSLAQLPRRMAEIICGACVSDDQPEGYLPLPEAQSHLYGPSKPYSTASQTMDETQVLQQTTALQLVGTAGFGHGFFDGDGASHTVPAPAPFAQASQLQSPPEMTQESFNCSPNTAFPDFFSDQLVKQEPDLLISPIFGQSSLIHGHQAHVNSYGFDELHVSVAPSLQPADHSPVLGPGPSVPISSESLLDSIPLGPWGSTDMQNRQSNFDILLPNQRGGKRGPFRDHNLREQTAQTRRIGSCIRCRMQRVRVSSTRTGRFPCLRYKITDIRLFKPGQVPGYEWTRRWNNNISDPIQKWASSDVKFINISAGYSTKNIELRVRKFVPQDGDKLERTWYYEGRKKSVRIPPYALMNLDDGKSAYMTHIQDAMGDTLQHIAERSSGLLRETYTQAFRMYQDPSIPEDWKELFDWTFRLWVAIRLSTTSEFIVGEEKLDMPDDILDSTSPNSGKIPVPPVLGAQLDLVLIHHIQTKLRRELLDKLQRMVLKNKQSTWFVTYLVTFMLLHNAALITAHDAAYARKHGIRRRFAREDKVKEYHLGANILLAHFHYCNKGWYPFSEDCKDQDLRTLADLSDDQIQFVHATRRFAREHKRDWEQVREQGAWEDDYFFVSQLFEENWHPRTDA